MGKSREELSEQMKKLKELRAEIGMNRTEFSKYMDIPLRTLEEWEGGRRKMPDYVLRLITYYIKTEEMRKDKNSVVSLI